MGEQTTKGVGLGDSPKRGLHGGRRKGIGVQMASEQDSRKGCAEHWGAMGLRALEHERTRWGHSHVKRKSQSPNQEPWGSLSRRDEGMPGHPQEIKAQYQSSE